MQNFEIKLSPVSDESEFYCIQELNSALERLIEALEILSDFATSLLRFFSAARALKGLNSFNENL